MADIQVANSDADLSDNTIVTEENAYTITGLHTFSRSTNAPFAVVSGAAVVANLDADKLDGQQGSYYLAAANFTGTLAVNRGGTGAATFTDGGVLLGSGTGAITAMAVLADSTMIVGDGSGDPVAESGATLRTSVGVGTGDSPQFTGIELGHATDTTLTKASSGDVNIEGNIIYRAGGTDVPVADGGTGVGTLTDGGVLLGSGTGSITPMAVLANSEMIVGDGSGDPVAETGSTLRTSIGCDVATNITSGTMATARLGSGTASSGTFLRGDSSWTAVSATNAAGSDTQVQYNDGGTNFGGDAGLVYNDSTDVLTSGKLATTDTSATSIDVAGGITAGTSNIAIVNAVGKIPALSSTYLADLSGSNLTGLASAITNYSVTQAQVVNTTSSTAFVTFTVPADTWAAGDVIRVFCSYLLKNNSGGAADMTWYYGVNSDTQAFDSSRSVGNNAAIRTRQLMAEFHRVVNDVWSYDRGISASVPQAVSFESSNPATNWSTPAFDSDITVTLKLVMSVANANTYLTPSATCAYKIAAG